jgi:hypothetical protein
MTLQTREDHEFRNVRFIKASRFWVGYVGEPFQRVRNIGKPGELIFLIVRALLILTSSSATALAGSLFLTR